jgi:hypothetical protein
MTDDYYLCPFCVSSWVCHGPHIDKKDLDKFYYRMRILQDDLAEFAKEVALEHGSNRSVEELAFLIQEKVRARDAI